MTDQEFHDKIVAFMARIDETLRALPCKNKFPCAIRSEASWQKWGAIGLGIGVGISGAGAAIFKLLLQ